MRLKEPLEGRIVEMRSRQRFWVSRAKIELEDSNWEAAEAAVTMVRSLEQVCFELERIARGARRQKVPTEAKP